MTKKDKNIQDENIEELEDAELNAEEQNIEKIDEHEQLKKKLEDSDSSYKRALADYQNLQKRVTDERLALIMSANRDLLLRILSVLDTLVLANQHDGSEGLKVAINQFLDVLKAEGVTRIETKGKEFDPQFMEAIVTETGEEGKVIDEIQAGFILNEKLLRPAQVKVGSANPPAGEAGQNKEE